MKKNTSFIIFAALAMIATLFSCESGNGRNNGALPKDAEEFLATHFPQKEVKEITETKMQMDYVVILDDGTEIDFTNTGQWEQVNLRWNEVPASLMGSLPSSISQYIDENCSDKTIHKIEKKSLGRKDFIYRITFHKPDDIELNFTQEGEIISDDPSGKKLPSSAKAFLNKHYPDISIISIVNDVDGDYNIRLEENTEIEFDRKGNWFEIKISKSQRLPESVLNLLPKKMNQYIEKNYPEQYIRRIEKKSYGYRVKLNKPNNVELSFTKTGDFQRIESKGSDSASDESKGSDSASETGE